MLFKYVQIRTTDILGYTRGMMVPLSSPKKLNEFDKDENLVRGASIDGSSIGYSNIENSDLHLTPDFTSRYQLPYTDDPIGVVFSFLTKNGKPFEGDPRRVLYNAQKQILGENGEMIIKPEPEFYLLNQDGSLYDEGEYATFYPTSKAERFITKIFNDLPKIGITPVVGHHEVGSSQYEVELGYSSAIKAVDKLILFKNLVRARAAQLDLKATFMPKPFTDQPGNGLHYHVIIKKDGVNLFAPEKKSEILSDYGLHFIAGILQFAKPLSAILSPTVNSYKRLVPGFEAPTYISWGPMNRSALIRIPMTSDPEKTRFEIRSGDFSGNPYLGLAVLLHAGNYGVQKKLEPPEPITDNLYTYSLEKLQAKNIETLPNSLGDALFIVTKHTGFMRKALGDLVFEEFLTAKLREWRDYLTNVTDWEKSKYFDL